MAAQAVALIIAASAWWRVWDCPCDSTLSDAAFWTSIVVSKAVVLLGLIALRVR